MKVINYYRNIQLMQREWMKPYTDFNVEEYVNKNKFGVMFHKLMMNSVFGKTMENARKYRDIEIYTNKYQKTIYKVVKKLK